MCAVSPEVTRGHQIPRTGFTDGCELSSGFWERNPGPLDKQPVVLIAKPALLLSYPWNFAVGSAVF